MDIRRIGRGGAAVVAALLMQTVVAAPADKATADRKALAPAMMSVRFEDLKWQKMQPELGERSAEIVILREDPATKATQLMIRVPKDFHVPKHWHSANETHTLVQGTFIVEGGGQRRKLGPGSWDYIPRRMAHEAWTTPEDGALLFITVDSAWDVHWVGGKPQSADFLGGRND